MNTEPDSSHEAESLQSNIDSTRQRMDNTIAEIGERLTSGRHLFDEVVGFFRSKSSSSPASAAPDALKAVGSKASSAYRGVIDTVKQNPLPAVLIGAGIGWMIYETRRSAAKADRAALDKRWSADYGRRFAPTNLSEKSGEPTGPSALEDVKGNVGQGVSKVKENAQEMASNVVGKARQGVQAVKDRAARIGSQVQESTKSIYNQSRDRVTTTVEDHPLEVGLGCLAAGIVAGLLLPTPKKVHEVVGPTTERLRDRAREAGQDFVQRGKRVVQAAKDAAMQEVHTQGLTPDALVDQADKAGDDALKAADQAIRSHVADSTAGSSGTGPRSSTAGPFNSSF